MARQSQALNELHRQLNDEQTRLARWLTSEEAEAIARRIPLALQALRKEYS